jgi:hypothetical protein
MESPTVTYLHVEISFYLIFQQFYHICLKMESKGYLSSRNCRRVLFWKSADLPVDAISADNAPYVSENEAPHKQHF